ncbi:MAG TPA: GspH/FimT family pseudopilin, partial [Psychromonas sp.]
MRFSSTKKSQGLTLIELLITMAIIIILAMVAVPSYSTFMANERFAVASNELYNAYRFARNEAIKTSSSMTLEATSVDDVWANGWQVTHYSGAVATVLSVSKVPHSSIIISGAA